ncbi:NAD(P)H-binding protein [Halobacteriovorax sp. RT-1-4]|uniref:NAD(P)H-binding protein n=1 Tax=unclassified Halobacteriovorax TaxID=2639665 RepID=UPI00399C447F
MRLLILGATGLVGSHVLKQAIERDEIEYIVAPVRREINSHTKLYSPIINFDQVTSAMLKEWNVDVVICALGTTIKVAGSKEAFKKVDLEYPLTFARCAKDAGVEVFVLNSAMGANESSIFFYNKVKGKLENALMDLHFKSLYLVRPGLIGGEREEFRLGELIAKFFLKALHYILPKSLRINPASSIAKVMLEAAIEQRAGIKIMTSDRLT